MVGVVGGGRVDGRWWDDDVGSHVPRYHNTYMVNSVDDTRLYVPLRNHPTHCTG